MCGNADHQPSLFHTYNFEDRIRPDHPLREVKRRPNQILVGPLAKFAAAYGSTGRPGVPS
jgi:hypothetical protein